ncbi:hypothetical protein [Synechococcus elongatus]|uniref:hypothetical protein n=1 Tax=Synechococcus elongatus TaxID=32046 RepID=UPI000F7E72C6|nr:hypothetical protein [Synechococcus elongatus]
MLKTVQITQQDEVLFSTQPTHSEGIKEEYLPTEISLYIPLAEFKRICLLYRAIIMNVNETIFSHVVLNLSHSLIFTFDNDVTTSCFACDAEYVASGDEVISLDRNGILSLEVTTQEDGLICVGIGQITELDEEVDCWLKKRQESLQELEEPASNQEER